MISFILAMDENRVIGKDNDLPWRLPADLAYFKRTTMGQPVIMGRKTYESIGRPLPGRENIVVTRNKDFAVEGITVVYSLEEAFEQTKETEAFVIGGEQIFKEAISFASRLYITQIHHTFEGDTYFPAIPTEWKIVSSEKGIKDEKNPYDYDFVVYEK
jgi:dihydrofolate reductase